MNEYWEEQVKRLKDFSTSELRKRITGVESFLAEHHLQDNCGYLNYLSHLKCEYAERIGK